MTKLFGRICTHRHKNNRLVYNAVSYANYLWPSCLKRPLLKARLSRFEKLDPEQREYVLDRVNYYNRLPQGSVVNDTPLFKTYPLSCLRLNAVFNGARARSPYIFDAGRYLSYYPDDFRMGIVVGDVTDVPPVPSLLKSRPLGCDNTNSVLLPLNRIRHFVFVHDRIAFIDKMDMLIGMAYIDQAHRRRFWEMYFSNPRCRLGNINRSYTDHPEWNVEPISIDEHLKYRYILCIEGNDVATCLKWVMSSNSLAVMPKPRNESWFMEGRLVGGYHYVEIKDDFSDLIEKMDYYSSHPDEAQRIIDNAHRFTARFFDSRRENLIALMTVDKYFRATGQK